MKNKLLVVFLFVATVVSAQEEYGRRIVKKLASSGYYGRGYVFNGDLKAAKYIAKVFKKNGISPLEGSDKDYFQYLTLSPNTFPKESHLQIDGKKLKVGKDFLIDAASKSIKGNFSWVKLSKVDYAQQLNNLLKNQNYQGKFIFIEEMEAIDALGNDSYKALMENLKKSGNHKGVLVNSTNKLLWRTLQYEIEKPVLYLKNYNIEKESGELSLDIFAEFKKDYQTQNVCGFLKGTGDTDSTIVITAHYDHIGAIGKNVIFKGANDNASGTALMLYLSNYFAKNPSKYNMVFLAFTGEESGLVGSKYFAENTLIDLSKVKFLLNLDMAGTGDDGIQVVNGSIFKSEFDKLVKINKAENLLPDVKIRGEMNRSDHYPFFERGVPCFFIYTLGGIDAYHDIYDVYETLPFTNFNNYAKLLIKYVNTFN